ncbi:MAG TPA: class II aldolase/adducin family protein [Caldisericia bacterium]|mgnify:CR=1 FL=1|nr:class II aldolase/adducin family protein [Caldisericia bacterium]HPF48996.1 class II aldolase/adducin family protein [Caldisericia bacterium]HPI83140.1 class II aldolase/adducin family protein [Caldisericia bacterium]HPQ92367.1 class II aldolase/adducin family protein [Caldisericia bacterium]HRV74535.1 class II aldolase/adducin family protein [Caldisericia bacterium]
MSVSIRAWKKNIVETARYLASRGWAEAGAGNISVAVNYQTRKHELKTGDNVDFTRDVNILATSSGSRFRKLGLDEIGLVTIDSSTNQIFHNFKSKKPTSEVLAHLLVHSKSVKSDHLAVVHCHTTSTVALTHKLHDNLSIQLMKMHTEMEYYFPSGICHLDAHKPGSCELAKETAKAFESGFRFIVWPHHGVVAIADSLDGCVDMIEAVEKAATMWLYLNP